MKQRKTDYGTVVLHWLFVAAICVAFVSGLRIATEAPDRTWLNVFDAILPRANVWTAHVEAALVLVALTLAHAIYLMRSGLSRRVRLDEARLRGLFGPRQARRGAISVLLTWAFFIAIAVLIVSGAMLYFGVLAGYEAATVHWYATWAIPAFAVLHILVHIAIGGASQLCRIFRPERLPPPPTRLDAVELLALLVEKSSPEAVHPHDAPGAPLQPEPPNRDTASGRQGTRRSHVNRPSRGGRRNNVTLQSNPFVVALAVAIAATSAFVATDWLSVDSLRVHRIASRDAPILDGDASDPVWRNSHSISVMTNQGGNFDGRGESKVEIRAVHDGKWAYFLFVWEDPTRSLKQLPLVKEIDGWHLLHDGYERGDEHAYNEDKFSVLLTTLDVDLAGDRTFHASPHPIPGAPSTMTGRGLHFTAAGLLADVWQWKASSSGPTGWMDDDHFGPPREPTPMQASNAAPYRGGFAPDPGEANYSENFNVQSDPTGEGVVFVPRRLPRDLAAMQAAMGQVVRDPDVGESDGARWFMSEAETVPFTPEGDLLIPVGTVVPGVIVAGDFSGDRADVRCAARWASGHWALEVVRRLDTQSRYDVPLRSGTYMRVAAFDHAQIRHTRHVRPIRLEVE
ncbi:MAG: cytochrome b/b6 domain-containing protein [Methylobacteriaceae bacterium]|nr:cytochrome b/b6 domain-containing protein [Methylobacteriaceae bacterium]